MKQICALAAALAIGGCGMVSRPVVQPFAPACPPGQETMRTAQFFFGRDIADARTVSDSAFRAFVDEVLTPAFPAGLTVLDGGGQWRGSENQLIREASKVVIIVVPDRPDSDRRMNMVRESYKSRFNQRSVLLVTQLNCVAF